jgi:hypothetical protein
MNELTVNLATKRVDHGYFKILIVAQAAIAEMLRKLFAVDNRFGISREINTDAVPHRNAIFHIEEKLLHGRSILDCVSRQPSLTLKQPADR